jgi:predicted O-methyltransferase YrrM
LSSFATESPTSIEITSEQAQQMTLQVLVDLVDRTSEIERGLTVLLGEFVKLRDEIGGQSGQTGAAVADRVALSLKASRQDLAAAAELAAATTSAQFAVDNFPTARALPQARATLRFAADQVRVPGLALEFGVASGGSLRLIAEALSEHKVFGFDVFTGLPEDWRTGFQAGAFAQTPPEVPGADIIVGLFEDTLPGFLNDHPGSVGFLHVDADLYSSTVTIFDHVGPRLVPGSIIAFDEYFNYPGWQQHEHRAWTEFVARTGITFEYLAYTVNHEQLVVRILTV